MHGAHDLLTRWPSLDVAAKRARLHDSFHFSPGPLSSIVAEQTAAAARAAAGLWRGEPSVWSGDAAVQKRIADRLGWMKSPALMADALPRLLAFADSIKRDGFTDVVLLGMGGSSLAPEVLRAVLGVAPGWPRLLMLDSTDPAAVRAASTPPDRTLYILASKSGTTIEPNSLAAHFQHVLQEAGIAQWAQHFVAITDEGTALAARARTERFRDVFINPSDIGGRYSALSYFGLVPAALMGQDVAALLGWGAGMLAAAEPFDFARGGPESGATPANPAVGLGLAIGAAARAGRDKLTLVAPSALEPFGLWVEQLIAESTGKEGMGIVPIAGEPLGEPASYGDDRFFVGLGLDRPFEQRQWGGVPAASIDVPEPAALGAEFVRWEIATAIAGALLGINPFDEPNVQQAKDATRALLDQYKATGHLPSPAPDRATTDGGALTLTSAAKARLGGRPPEAILSLLGEGEYFALLAYLGPDPRLADSLRRLRLAVRDRKRVATMAGYGPRYLHSTGQLHKGGPDNAVFAVITAAPVVDVPIPGERFSFGTLELAQALGDFQALDAAGRRAVHVHLPAPDKRLLDAVAEELLS